MFRFGDVVKFTDCIIDGRKDSGVVKDWDTALIGLDTRYYYLVQRSYENSSIKINHWYGQDEIYK